MSKKNVIQEYSYLKGSAKKIDPKTLKEHVKGVEKNVIPKLEKFQIMKEQTANNAKKLRINCKK